MIMNPAKTALCNNTSAYTRICLLTYDTAGRKHWCKWSEMKYDYEKNKDVFVIMYNFLKAFINGEFKFQFKNRGKNYLYSEMPAQCKNNLKALCASYEAFLSVADIRY